MKKKVNKSRDISEIETPKPSRRLKKALKELEYMEQHLDEYPTYYNRKELEEAMKTSRCIF